MSDRFSPACLDEVLDDRTRSVQELVKDLFNLTEVYKWQSLAVQALLHKKDVLIKAGTGMGKSLIFQAMTLASPTAIVLVVSEAEQRNIRAVAIHAATLQKDPLIWKKVDHGDYQLVFASPETLLDPMSHFQHHTLRIPTPFLQNLVAVAVDECHLMWSWEDFRVDFQRIGDLRNNLWHIPFVCLSATLTPNIQAYVHEVCKLRRPTISFNLSTRRDNINIAVVPINSARNYRPLTDLIPDDISDPLQISKTLIFVDDINAAKDIADALRAKLPALLHHRPPEVLIRTYWASIDDAKKTRTFNNIRSGVTRIAICTDAFGLGINIPDIERVIQWDVTERLSLDRLYQRLGRAARGRPQPGGTKPIGNGFIYVNKSILEAVPLKWEGAWAKEVSENLDHAESTITDEPFMTVPVHRRCLPKFGLPATPQTASYVRDHLLGLYRTELDAKAAHREAKKARVGTLQAKLSAAEKIDPAVLWVLTTTGCRHAALLSVFQDPNRWITTHHSWCCDVCAFRKHLDPKEARGGIPLEITAAYLRANPTSKKIILLDQLIQVSQPDSELGELRPEQITKESKEYVEKIIYRWRRSKLQELALPPSIVPCTVLPDKVVLYLSSNLKRIATEKQLFKALEHLHYDVESSMLTRKDFRRLLSLMGLALNTSLASVQKRDQVTIGTLLPHTATAGDSIQHKRGRSEDQRRIENGDGGYVRDALHPLPNMLNDADRPLGRPRRLLKGRDIWEGNLGR